MIEKKLHVERYIPNAQIEYIKDYRSRLAEFLCCFNEYKVRRYGKQLIDEIARIDLCIEKYYKSMEDTFFNIVVGDFIVEKEVTQPVIKTLESRLNKKKKKAKR